MVSENASQFMKRENALDEGEAEADARAGAAYEREHLAPKARKGCRDSGFAFPSLRAVGERW
jgi:hypothetical protein